MYFKCHNYFHIQYLMDLYINTTYNTLFYSNRNSAFGFCRMCSFLANILCPLILLLNRYWPPLPSIIFGSLALVAGVLAILFPETRGKKMPDTLEDGENIGWLERLWHTS